MNNPLIFTLDFIAFIVFMLIAGAYFGGPLNDPTWFHTSR